jgi:hypothetical protein
MYIRYSDVFIGFLNTTQSRYVSRTKRNGIPIIYPQSGIPIIYPQSGIPIIYPQTGWYSPQGRDTTPQGRGITPHPQTGWYPPQGRGTTPQGARHNAASPRLVGIRRKDAAQRRKDAA